MKVVLLKKHSGKSEGSILDVPLARANYLIRMGVAKKYVAPKPKSKPAKNNET